MDIMKRVIELQTAEGYSDSDYAKLLGVSKAMWSLIKAGKVEPGAKMLGGVWKRYPALRADVEAYWLSKLETGDVEFAEAIA